MHQSPVEAKPSVGITATARGGARRGWGSVGAGLVHGRCTEQLRIQNWYENLRPCTLSTVSVRLFLGFHVELCFHSENSFFKIKIFYNSCKSTPGGARRAVCARGAA